MPLTGCARHKTVSITKRAISRGPVRKSGAMTEAGARKPASAIMTGKRQAPFRRFSAFTLSQRLHDRQCRSCKLRPASVLRQSL